MHKQPPNRVLITLPLEVLVKQLLDGHSFVVINRDLAELLLMITKNRPEFNIHIQMPESDECNLNVYERPIPEPRLWDFAQWQMSTEKWLRGREYSRLNREARFIEEENIRRVAKAIRRMFSLEEDPARCLALEIVRKQQWDKAKALGVSKIVTKFEELP